MVQRWCFWGWSLVSVKCLALIFHMKMSMKYSWSNVNLCRTHSDKQQWNKITFSLILNRFDRNITKSNLNIYLLFCVQ